MPLLLFFPSATHRRTKIHEYGTHPLCMRDLALAESLRDLAEFCDFTAFADSQKLDPDVFKQIKGGLGQKAGSPIRQQRLRELQAYLSLLASLFGATACDSAWPKYAEAVSLWANSPAADYDEHPFDSITFLQHKILKRGDGHSDGSHAYPLVAPHFYATREFAKVRLATAAYYRAVTRQVRERNGFRARRRKPKRY